MFERLETKGQPRIYQIFGELAEDDPEVFGRTDHLPVLREYSPQISQFLETQRLKNFPSGSPLPEGLEGEDGSRWKDRGRRIERWFAADPVAATAWLKSLPDETARQARLADLANSAVMRDLQSLDRALEIFTDPGEREALMRGAIYPLTDFNSTTKAALLDFVGKYPEAAQYVRRPQWLEP